MSSITVPTPLAADTANTWGTTINTALSAIAGVYDPAVAATAAAVTDGATIDTTNIGMARIAPAANRTGLILEAGTTNGQTLTVTNESQYTVRFAADATSNVHRGLSTVIPPQGQVVFRWRASDSRWVVSGLTPVEIPAYLFGLVASGSDSDAAANATALTAMYANKPAGGVTYILDEGTYYITGINTAVGSNVKLRGRGMYRTTLKLPDATNADFLRYNSNPSDVSFEDLTIDGNKAGQTADHSALEFVLGNHITLTRVRITGASGNAFFPYQCSNVTVDQCRFEDNGRTASTNGTHSPIQFYAPPATSVSHLKVLNTVIDGAVDTAILCGGSGTLNDVEIAGCTILNGQWIGIGTGNGTTNFRIHHNYVADISGNAIDLGGCTQGTVDSNVIERCEAGIIPDGAPTYGLIVIKNNVLKDIYVSGGDYVSNGTGIGTNSGPLYIVEGNVLVNIAGSGIVVLQNSRARVVNNYVFNCGIHAAAATLTSYGIYVFGASGATVTNCEIIGNTIGDNQGTPTTTYGLAFSGSSSFTSGHVIERNRLVGTFGTGPVGFFASATHASVGTFRNNEGYVAAGDILTGAGSPESVVTAPIGALYLRTDGSTSTTLYVKTSGTGNTGWTAK